MSSDLQSIPCVLMRGGTSKGAFFLGADLPQDAARRDAVLLSVMGSGHPLQIDGIGGGNPLSSKVAIVSRSTRAGADVDYLFAQVKVVPRIVDTSANCGNMMSAVGPFAIEAGLVPAQGEETRVRIFNVNTGKVVVATVPTPGGRVRYCGETAIAGVPGTGAAISLSFVDAAGAVTGRLFPTGRVQDEVDGLAVTCIDCAMPMVLVAAGSLGLRGSESPAALDADTAMLARLERLRVEAGRRMGIADAASRVVPKPVLISAPEHGGALQVRYFMPQHCHGALAITGAVGLATACVTPGTLANGIAFGGGARAAGDAAAAVPGTISLEHPSGSLDVHLTRRESAAGAAASASTAAGDASPNAAGEAPTDAAPFVASVVRTARRLFEGHVLTHVLPWS